MPLIQSQAQYECVAKQWRALKACEAAQAAMRERFA